MRKTTGTRGREYLQHLRQIPFFKNRPTYAGLLAEIAKDRLWVNPPRHYPKLGIPSVDEMLWLAEDVALYEIKRKTPLPLSKKNVVKMVDGVVGQQFDYHASHLRELENLLPREKLEGYADSEIERKRIRAGIALALKKIYGGSEKLPEDWQKAIPSVLEKIQQQGSLLRRLLENNTRTERSSSLTILELRNIAAKTLKRVG